MNLQELGWGYFFEQQIEDSESGLLPARVCREDINQYHLLAENRNLIGTLPGKLRHSAHSRASLPAVGDWVLTSSIEGGELDYVQIERMLERKSKISRREAGDTVSEQVIAANIDTVFIVCGLDDDFNIARIERYMLLCEESNSEPVILLNKADIKDDHTDKIKQLSTIAVGVAWHLISAKENTGLEAVRQYIGPGTTSALLGSSGAGKSTIINVLLGYKHFDTQSVRPSDSRGRHTTTFREMVALPNKGLIIDTPGMRELQIWLDGETLTKKFKDIAELALQCKFSDCGHNTEPDCAIRNAITDGSLDKERFKRYQKIEKEVIQLESRQKVKSKDLEN